MSNGLRILESLGLETGEGSGYFRRWSPAIGDCKVSPAHLGPRDPEPRTEGLSDFLLWPFAPLTAFFTVLYCKTWGCRGYKFLPLIRIFIPRVARRVFEEKGQSRH